MTLCTARSGDCRIEDARFAHPVLNDALFAHTHAHLCSLLLWSYSFRDFAVGLIVQVVRRGKVWQASQHERSAEGKRQAQGRSGGLQWSRHIICLDGPYSPSLGCCQGVHRNRPHFSFLSPNLPLPPLLPSPPLSISMSRQLHVWWQQAPASTSCQLDNISM